MKKIVSLLLIFIMLLSFNTAVFAEDDSNIRADNLLLLSEFEGLSPDQTLELLLINGLKMPETYDQDMKLAKESAYIVIQDMIISGMKAYSYGYTELIKLADNIYNIVEIDKKYIKTESKASSYTLVNSTVYGSWSDSYLNYNCYQYALGYTGSAQNPGYYSGQTLNISSSISTMADLVIDDLDVLGYYAYKTTTKPTSLASWEKVICVRKCSVDYHFMKGSGVNTWYHKPGKTNLLQWKYSSPGYTYWTNENWLW